MTWLRPGVTSNWITITIPSYIYVKCMSTFWCCKWPYGCILTVSKPWVWSEMAESGSHLGSIHTTTTNMTWLRPGVTSDWITITIPSYIYVKCLSSFWCCKWPYGCIITVSKPWVCAPWILEKNIEMKKKYTQPGFEPLRDLNPWALSTLYCYEICYFESVKNSGTKKCPMGE
jgi:hypothetical protein